ncbi:MAG: hypothetical protein IT310_13825, partial [Anaerolineales bacterium]|nr:hypothetical protein [Anaerolineales bacterium]
GEQAIIATQMAYYGLINDQENLELATIEWQMELTDGGAPGNTLANEVSQQLSKLGPDAVELIGQYGNDIIPLLLKHKEVAVDIIGAYGDKGIALLTRYGNNAVDLITTYGTPAVDLMMNYGDDAIEVLSNNNLSPSEISYLSKLPGKASELSQDVQLKIGVDYKNSPMRMEYEGKVSDLAKQLNQMIQNNNGIITEADARVLSEARRNLGIEYKNMTPGPLRDYIYELNTIRYGDPLGPDWKYLMRKYDGNYLEIAEATAHPNKDINKFLSDFSDWLGLKDTEYLLEAELRVLRGE